jgi:acetyl-CoA carboxylase biotin carboxyl carrier protein
MNPEEIEALKQLIEFLQGKKVGEFRLERGDLKIELKFEAAFAAAATATPHIDPMLLARLIGNAGAAPAVPSHEAGGAAVSAVPDAPPPPAEEVLHTVKSPIVGTFYESPSPGSSAFVKIGDQVEVGQPLCIVEAMKLMNEIESDVAGEIVKRLVQNGQPIEYGQPLFAVRTR